VVVTVTNNAAPAEAATVKKVASIANTVTTKAARTVLPSTITRTTPPKPSPPTAATKPEQS